MRDGSRQVNGRNWKRTWRLASAAIAVGLATLAAPAAGAASFDCNAREISEARLLICGDIELSRTDDRVARRLRGLEKRQGLGLYLSLRYWNARANDARDECLRDRACILAVYRAQSLALDRLQACLDSGARRRSCLRAALTNEETAAKNSAGRAAP